MIFLEAKVGLQPNPLECTFCCLEKNLLDLEIGNFETLIISFQTQSYKSDCSCVSTYECIQSIKLRNVNDKFHNDSFLSQKLGNSLSILFKIFLETQTYTTDIVLKAHD